MFFTTLDNIVTDDVAMSVTMLDAIAIVYETVLVTICMVDHMNLSCAWVFYA